MAEQSESFVRWQGITREQFTVASSVVFGLAVSALGYLATTLLDDKVVRVTCLQFASVLLLTASVGAGIFVVINRLRDFRGTTRMVKLRESGKQSDEVAKLETWTNKLGVRSWRLFWAQVWTFFFGVAAFAVHLLGAVWSKLQ